MKMSIIMGVLQMNMGLFLSLLNSLHFRNAIDVWCEYVPQAIFMLSIFGYLVFCIFLKWSIDWVEIGEPAPSLISLLIDFFMKPGDIKPGQKLYDGQSSVQTYLLLVAFISLPWMLFSKPYFLRRQYLKVSGYKTLKREDTDGSTRRLMADDAASDVSDKNGKYHEEEFDFGEVMMHQLIHTIEYALGCISNTASYLRLWALSLAHKQLSHVFYNMILKGGLDQCKGSVSFTCVFGVFAAFAIWTGCTLGILCCMELLSAFLHALRLHWVEFQNKFYKGDGRKFAPFSFEAEAKKDDE